MIRLYEPGDRAAVLQVIQSTGLWCSDPDDPVNVTSVVAEEEGRVVAAIFGRMTIEPMLYLDRSVGKPASRWQTVKSLYRVGSAAAVKAGARELHIFLPPEDGRNRGYARRVAQLPHVRFDNRIHFMLDPAAFAGTEGLV